LLIVLIFGIILNNYKIFFVGFLAKSIDEEKVNGIQNYFKIIIMESAFVVRTFFFILFGYYVSLGSLLNFEVIIISLVLLATIYSIRFILIFPTMGGRSWPELFLSPRGLITILLFFSIPDEYVIDKVFHSEIIPGILLFIILGSALAMSNALIGVKKLQSENKIDTEIDVDEENTDIDNSYTVISDENIKPTNFEADDPDINNEISDTSDKS
jgi:NhaP-type Na+/H+ or K+/H+ antiporter